MSILVLFTALPAIIAQIPNPQPDVEKTDPVQGYVTPSASQSVEIGDYYLRKGKYKAALSRFQEAVKTDPHYAPAYRELGRVYEKMGSWKRSLDSYQKYLDELPSAKEAREARNVHRAIDRLHQDIFAEGESSSHQPAAK